MKTVDHASTPPLGYMREVDHIALEMAKALAPAQAFGSGEAVARRAYSIAQAMMEIHDEASRQAFSGAAAEGGAA